MSTSGVNKLREVDEKLGVVRAAIADLVRLEEFLVKQHEELAKGVRGGYLGAVSISQKEVDTQLKRARELIEKWRPR